MKRYTPPAAPDITLYMRTYYSLLRTSQEVQIRTLEETHLAMHSALHPGGDELRPDMSAFIYSSLRLPPCIRDVRLIVLAQSEATFVRAGYTDIATWTSVSAPGRRRRMMYNGKDTLAAFIASISDIDDIVPILVALQIEWNKMHMLLNQHRPLVARLLEAARSGRMEASLKMDAREALQLLPEEWDKLERVWGAALPEWLAAIAQQRKRFALQLLSGSYVAYRQATQRWWEHVSAQVPFDISERPVYFVSSNTHSLVNMLTGFAQRHEAELLSALENGDGDLYAEAQRIRRGEIRSNWENLLYYALKKYLASPEGAALAQQRLADEAESGITRIPSVQTFDLEAQVIDVQRLRPDFVDSRLRDLPLARLANSNAVILNIDYPLGFAAYHLLSQIVASVAELRGVYIIGKAATLNGRIGDVLIPNVVYDEHSQNTYLFNNAFRAADVAPYLVYGDVLDNQRALTVRGTFLQNKPYMAGFLEAGYTDVEMEAGPYLSALYELMRPRRYPTDELINLYPMTLDIGILHYASDTPMSKGQNLGTQNLSYYGMDPTYAATVAVLRRILHRATQIAA